MAVKKGPKKLRSKVDPKSCGQKWTHKVAVKKGPQKWWPKVNLKSGSLGPTIRIGQEIRCLPYAGFFFIEFGWLCCACACAPWSKNQSQMPSWPDARSECSSPLPSPAMTPASAPTPAHPYPREKFRLKKSTKKRILRNFICHLDRHFLKFLAISVGNQQRTETTNPLQIDTF